MEETRSLEDTTQNSLIRHVVVGIALGMIGFGLITVGVCRLGAPEEGWRYALAVGGYAGAWAGLFFGSAGGVGAWGIRQSRRAHAVDVTVRPSADRASAQTPRHLQPLT